MNPSKKTFVVLCAVAAGFVNSFAPAWAEDAYSLGCGFLAKSDMQKAIVQFTKAIEANPQYSMAYCKRGEAYAFLEQRKKARQDYDKAILLDGKNAQAFYDRGHYWSS